MGWASAWLLLAGLALGHAADCDVANIDKWDCGAMGTNQAQCESDGCCWVPVSVRNESLKGIPWCFYPSDVTRPPNVCDDGVIWDAPDPGFTDDFYDIMYANYLANLNIQGSGAVVAAPDQETPGGSYYYHWMRDAGLSIKAWLDINDNDYNKVKTELDAYAGWVKKVQHKADPNNIDVRIEPKFTIPDGEPYTGGWCRPQTDGPALRAMAMSKWGMIVKDNGGDTASIWEVVSFDMAWVLENWMSEGCDLWEEVRSNDFFFNRMAYIYSLNEAAKFADAIGESGATYRATADKIKTATQSHFADGFLYESTNRPYDGAVIHSIATFGEYLFPPDSEEAAATIKVLVKAFCNEYPINQENIAAGKPGLLIGRYPGDSYAGGNPWQLLTAVFGELFYLGGKSTLRKIEQRGDYSLRYSENKEWMSLLKLPEGSTARDLARAQVAAGDAVMTRLFDHVQDAAGRIDEQIDKHTGKQSSAEGLTWSYANILHALHVRKNLDPGDFTTSGPTTPKPTTAATGGTHGPTTQATTEGPPATCCNDVKLVSTGGLADTFPNYVGKYRKLSTDSLGRKVFQKVGGGAHLHYVEDLPFKYETWIVSDNIEDTVGNVINDKKDECADATGSGWMFLTDSTWHDDPTAQVVCDGSVVNCCTRIEVASTGGIAGKYPDLLGTYAETFRRSSGGGSHPVYAKGDTYLYFLEDIPHHFEGWTIASGGINSLGPVSNLAKADCADGMAEGWEYLDDGGAWQPDTTFTVTCLDF
jgi:glucoamylase